MYSVSDLLEAAKTSNLELIDKILAEQPELEKAVDDKGYTFLHIAAQFSQDVDFVRSLLKKYKFRTEESVIEAAELRTSEGRTPLLCAAMSGNEAIFDLFVSEFNTNAQARDNGNRNALHLAARYSGNLGFIKELVNKYKFHIEENAFPGKTVLLYAAQGGNLDIVKWLVVNKKASLRAFTGAWPLGALGVYSFWPRIYAKDYAAQSNHQNIVDFLEEYEKNPAAFPKEDDSADEQKDDDIESSKSASKEKLYSYQDICQEAANGDWGQVEEMAYAGNPQALFALGLAYENGDGVSESKSICRALYYYQKAAEGNEDRAAVYQKALLSRLPESPEVVDFSGYELAHFAARFADKADIQSLLQDKLISGSETTSQKRETPLHIATRYNSAALEALLEERCCQPEQKNQENYTAFQLAVVLDSEAAVAVWCERTLNLLDQCERQNLFHLAAQFGNTEILKQLIEYLLKEQNINTKEKIIAILQAPNSQGLTPLKLARDYAKHETITYLLEFGVDVESVNPSFILPQKSESKGETPSLSYFTFAPPSLAELQNQELQEQVKRAAAAVLDVEFFKTLRAKRVHYSSKELNKENSWKKIQAQLEILLTQHPSFVLSVSQPTYAEQAKKFREELLAILCDPKKIIQDYFKRPDLADASTAFNTAIASVYTLLHREDTSFDIKKTENTLTQAYSKKRNILSKQFAPAPAPVASSGFGFMSTPRSTTSTEQKEYSFSAVSASTTERRENFANQFADIFNRSIAACEAITQGLANAKTTKGEEKAAFFADLAKHIPSISVDVHFVPFTFEVGKAVECGFRLWGYICKINEEARIARLAGFFRTSLKDRVLSIYRAAYRIYDRYQFQLELLKNNDGSSINRAASFAAFCAINYILAEENCCVANNPSFFQKAAHTFKNLGNEAPSELVLEYLDEESAIYDGVVYGKFGPAEEKNKDIVETKQNKSWNLCNLFRNPRIRDEDGVLYTNSTIEGSTTIDFGECLGTKEEAEKRGYRLITPEEEQAYKARWQQRPDNATPSSTPRSWSARRPA